LNGFEGKQLLRVGDLARRAGKSVRAIHLYEELDLLHPVTRSSGGFRLYEPSALERVRWIDLLHGLGFSLHEIRAVLRGWWSERVGPVAMSELRALFERKLGETRDAITRHQTLAEELEAGLRYLDACNQCSPSLTTDACPHCPQDHGVEREPALVAGLLSQREHAVRRSAGRASFVRSEDVGSGT
jgi:DNA-binding transcriptional MerR regulator